MKVKFILLLFISTIISAQNAADYFYPDTGSVWYSEGIALDSLGQPIDSFSFYQADSFITNSIFHGDSSSLLLSSYSSTEFVYFSPYIDSTFFKFDGAIAYEYLKFTEIIDSLVYVAFDSSMFNALDTLQGWYPIFNFAAALNNPEELLSRDFTVTLDTATVNMRIKLTAERLPGETLQLEVDTFQTKKFNHKLTLYLLLQILPPPLPPQEIPFIELERTVWVAPGNWVVKEHSPSQVYDFSRLGGETHYMPGILRVRIDKPIAVSVGDEINPPDEFKLLQNYPNPFNPATKIKYSIPAAGSAKYVSSILKVYDVLGREVATLVNGIKAPGNYEVIFDGSNLSSGIYFYKLTAGGFSSVKKMMLLK